MIKIFTLLFIILAYVSPVVAAEMSNYSFLKISGSDARAVVQTSTGEKQLVAPGDVLEEGVSP